MKFLSPIQFNKFPLLLLSVFFLSYSHSFSQVQLKPSIGISALPNDTDSVCPIVPRAQGNPWIPVSAGDTMADFKLYDSNGDSVVLSSVLNSGKRALIVSGSYTCPIFRNHMSKLNDVAAQYGSQIECFVVYTVEAHPTGSSMPSSGNYSPTNPPYYQPTTYGERKTIVSDLISGVGVGQYIPVPINVPIYIDGPCNEWWHYYDAPNNAYLVDTNGVLFAYHEWFSNSNPPNNTPTNIWCDIDSLLGVNSGGCTQITGLGGTFDFQLNASPSETGNPGDVIDIFGKIKNTSSDGVEVFIQRVMNDLPSATWESSMCITVCLAAIQDTVSVIIAAGDSVDFSMHFFTDILMSSVDTGRVRIRFSNKNGSQQPEFQMFRGITELKTNIDEIDNKQLKIYPNPTDGIIYFDNTDEIESVIVYAVNGQIIKEIFNPQEFIDITDLKQGLYFLKIHEGDKIHSTMIIKED